jgi:release factor glutamine methyltransferase
LSALILRDVYKYARKQLEDANIDTASLDARIILKHILKIDETDLIANSDTEVSVSDSQLINTVLHRRINGEPISQIVGHKEFWSLDFKVTKDVLDPRPDSETLINAALSYFGDTPPTLIADLGTGTGCLPIALLTEWPNCQAIAVDISEKALAVASENAKTHGVSDRIRFVQGSWAEPLNEKFDLVLSNPPYITSADIESLSVEVRKFDPILALDGGEDGLDCYKKIISSLKSIMKPHGICLLESGYNQDQDIARLAKDTGLSVNAIHPDLAGIARAVEISFGEK